MFTAIILVITNTINVALTLFSSGKKISIVLPSLWNAIYFVSKYDKKITKSFLEQSFSAGIFNPNAISRRDV